VNPIWTKTIVDAVKRAMKTCSHCKRSAAYAKKSAGQFYTCKHCGHKFKEKSR
jgi:ribosomal protein L37AE/L43A